MENREIIEGIAEKQAEKYGLPAGSVEKTLNWIEAHGAGVVRFKSLIRGSDVEEQPEYLFYWGDKSSFDKYKVAFVGTRKPDGYGRSFVESAASAYRDCEISTVSGFAVGIDSAVHSESLKNGITTIAVTGSGFAVNYPSANASLKNRIIKGGVMLSEYSPYVRASRVNLISRNRIISAISDTVVIVQGAERSGTLNTLNWALKMNRRVLALPGNIENKLSFAPNYALSQGAGCITSVGMLPLASGVKKRKAEISVDEKTVLELIKNSGNTDDLLSASPFTKEKLFSIIVKLELKGAVRRDFNGTIYSTED